MHVVHRMILILTTLVDVSTAYRIHRLIYHFLLLRRQTYRYEESFVQNQEWTFLQKVGVVSFHRGLSLPPFVLASQMDLHQKHI